MFFFLTKYPKTKRYGEKSKICLYRFSFRQDNNLYPLLSWNRLAWSVEKGVSDLFSNAQVTRSDLVWINWIRKKGSPSTWGSKYISQFAKLPRTLRLEGGSRASPREKESYLVPMTRNNYLYCFSLHFLSFNFLLSFLGILLFFFELAVIDKTYI